MSTGNSSAEGSTDPRPGGRRRIDRVLADGFLDGLSELPLDEVRARRRDAEQEEVDLSYVRRMLQGRADLLRAELDRRGSGPSAAPATAHGTPAEGAGGQGGTDADLVARLTAVLTDSGGRSDHGLGRFLTVEPSRVDEHRRAVEQLLADVHVSDVAGQSEQDLRAALGRVEDVEREVSANRRRVQDVMDALTAEVGRRYQDGRARVEDLLPEG